MDRGCWLASWLFLKATNLQAVARHAGHPARRAEKGHALDAAFPKNLGADAIGAQVHAACARAMARFGCALELRQQLLA